VAVDRHQLTIRDALDGLGYAIHAWDAELSGDNSSMNQHTSSPLDNGGGQRNKMSHAGLYGVAHEHFAGTESSEIIRMPNPTR
jgi:hypothetical protein